MSRSPRYLLPIIGGTGFLLAGAGLTTGHLSGTAPGLPAAAEAQEAAPAAPVGPFGEPGASREGGYGLGREAMLGETVAWDIDVRPDGTGLPEGSGDVWTGEEVFVEKCAACHGDFGEAVGRWPQLAGGFGTLTRQDPVKTVGSYWPYLSTVWDYVHRAMPFGEAQSLSADEVYALTAYLLYLNNVAEDDFTLSHENFADVVMPNADGFYMDDRPETELGRFARDVCMEDCKESVEITMRAAVLDVTPDDGTDDGTSSEQDAATETAAAEPSAEAPDPELVAAGEGVFRRCQACHQVGEDAENSTGPVLTGIVGREAASVSEFRYSPVLAEAGESGLVWTRDHLAEFLADPRGYLKGNRMSFQGLRSEEEIDAVIAFLRSHGE